MFLSSGSYVARMIKIAWRRRIYFDDFGTGNGQYKKIAVKNFMTNSKMQTITYYSSNIFSMAEVQLFTSVLDQAPTLENKANPLIKHSCLVFSIPAYLCTQS